MGNLDGWIKLHRRIRNHWIWEKKPFSEGQAFLDMVMMANHDTKEISIGKETITVERGSFVTSEAKLAAQWGWSRHKVRSFLEGLQKDCMAARKSNNKRTYLNIVNYSDFQDIATAKGTATGQQNGQQRDTNKKIKKYKEEKKYIYSGIRAFTSNKELIKTFDEFLEMREKIKKPATDKAIQLILKRLHELSDDEETQIRILEQSIERNWQTVYALKEDPTKDFDMDKWAKEEEPPHD